MNLIAIEMECYVSLFPLYFSFSEWNLCFSVAVFEYYYYHYIVISCGSDLSVADMISLYLSIPFIALSFYQFSLESIGHGMKEKQMHKLRSTND